MLDLTPEDLILLSLVLALVVGLGLYMAFSSSDDQGKLRKRLGNSDEPKAKKATAAEAGANRRKSVADTLKELERANKEKISLRARLQRAGIKASPRSFFVASGFCGLACCVLMLILAPRSSPFVIIAAGFVGAFGLPRWALATMAKRRQNKFIAGFAASIDVIVRGVKSGLPLNECLAIIAREAPSPINEEFTEVIDQQRLGVPLPECFERMVGRLPIAEVKFFAIVVAIQAQSGGNLSEALGNLANVLRERRRLADKVKALSAEAKASAMVLASMPFIVSLMVYFTSPKYISLLWTSNLGILLLIASGVWMSIGIFVMRGMINFKY